MSDKPLVIAGKTFSSRLIIGSGKYPSFEVMQRCHEASGSQMVTVAVRRLDPNAKGAASMMHWIDTHRMTLLPNTAGCYTADDAVRTCRLAEELGMSKWVKLEVLGDEKTLYPDVEETLKAAKVLVKEGFTVLPYTSDDPITARKLEDLGCAVVMPLAAPQHQPPRAVVHARPGVACVAARKLAGAELLRGLAAGGAGAGAGGRPGRVFAPGGDAPPQGRDRTTRR